MDVIVYPGKLHGNLSIIPSKSQAHRLLICAAFARGRTEIVCPQISADMEATADCLRALGANIQYRNGSFYVEPVTRLPDHAALPCRESGSTLRFLLPIVGALGVNTTFEMAGRLPQRPLSPLWEELERMGCKLSRPTKTTLHCQGKLHSGEYRIDGSVSSQFVSGLMMAMPLVEGFSSLTVTGRVESAPYIEITRQVLRLFNADDRAKIRKELVSPGKIRVEGDWSNAAFFLTANYLDSSCNIIGLDECSPQGDRAVKFVLEELSKGYITLSGQNIPDLIPILSIAASQKNGALFEDVGRLRLKESDRIASTCSMLNALGIKATATADTIEVLPGKFCGGVVDACLDHRIAMSAAIAATVSTQPVTILGADCVAKSYPQFWDEFSRLGGKYEQQLR